MRKVILLALVFSAFIACKNNNTKTEEHHDHDDHDHSHASASDVDFSVSEGTIYWVGSKPTGDKHTGTIKVTEGKVNVSSTGEVVGGEFTIDMNTISATDLEGESKDKLDGHLKADDFFNVAEFPTAKFVIDHVTAVSDMADVTHNLEGKLTMKNITKPVTVPVNIAVIDGKATIVSTSFDIDRTEWDIQYNSGKFFSDLKDKLINDKINLNLNVVAQK